MRRISRIRQPILLAAAPAARQCTCAAAAAAAAPAIIPISARRALSTTPALRDNQKTRKALWQGGEAPGPADPYDPEAARALKQEQLERELVEAEAELAAYEAEAKQYEAAQKTVKKQRQRPRSSLKTKNPRTWAPTGKESEARGYVPARRMDELQEVAGLEGWWDQEGHWGKENEYVGFSARAIAHKVTDPKVCEALVRQAVVEVIAIGALGKEKELTRAWAKGDRTAFDRAMSLGVKIKEDGSVVYGGDEKAARQLVHLMQPSKKAVGEVEIITPEEAKELVDSLDPSWKNISLQDPRLKFAVHKRVFQLTGQYVHDAKLWQVNTVFDLITAVVKPPKVAKVAEAIRERGELFRLPNVRVHDRRVTSIDKEIMVGRWKVIKEELEKRNLPVTGHEHLPRPVQRKWIQGQA